MITKGGAVGLVPTLRSQSVGNHGQRAVTPLRPAQRGGLSAGRRHEAYGSPGLLSLMGLSLIGVSCLEVGVLDPSILKTERPPRHLISACARPLPTHAPARSALPRKRVRSLTHSHRCCPGTTNVPSLQPSVMFVGEKAVRTKFIVNPMANKGRCGTRWPRICAELENAWGPLAADDIAMTCACNHATALASEAVGAGYRRLVVVGGDGTFSEVLNGVIVDDRPIAPDLVLAQVPGGTSNELSRSFGHRSLADASRAVTSGQTRAIDIFRVDAKGYSGNRVTRYGFVLAIVGAPATISWRAQRVPLLKRLGPVSYVIMTAITTLTYGPRIYRVQIDDEAEQSLALWGLLLCSFEGAGEGLMLAPGADPGDGKLDVILLGNLGRWESLTRVVPKLGDGSYIAQPKISRRYATRVTIASDRDVRADVDGESIGQSPMSIALLPFRMRVAVSRPRPVPFS
jgi:diacylglycerol kinase (ATP)